MKLLQSVIWLGLTLLIYQPAFSQFQFEKVKQRFVYQPEKRTSFYSNTHFNRIEGWYLNLGVRARPRRAPSWTLFADAGYGFKNNSGERWRYNVGWQREMMSPGLLTIGAKYFNQIFTQDTWIIGSTENTISAVFGHKDYMDYVGRKGGMAFVDYKWQQLHTLRLEVLSYKYEPLSIGPNTEWSLFARKKRYSANPHSAPDFSFQKGNETAIRAMAALDFRDNPIFPLIGWYFEGIVEKTFGDFTTTGLFLTLKRFQPTIGNHRLKARLLFGSRTGSFAFQHLLSLGGVGSLRGYEDKEFIGNRLLFGSVQYNFGGDILQRLPLDFIPFWETLTLGVFADAGYAWIADPSNANAGLFSFGDFSVRDIKPNFGLSLIFSEGLLRFDFARRTDRGSAKWQVFFRILNKF